MARTYEHPTVTTKESNGGTTETTTKHPAYAQIGAHRISGSARLYGSDFNHGNYIRIRIAPSELRRDLSHDWPYAGSRSYIEVDLSEAQWATMVSSMNIGDGVPCTLRYKDGVAIPEIADPLEGPHDKFEDEAKEKLTRALGSLEELWNDIDDLKVSEKQKNALKSRVTGARQQLVSGVPFVLKQFGEHMEKTVEKAKVEVNAYVTGTVMRAGLKALGGSDEVPLLELHSPKKDAT